MKKYSNIGNSITKNAIVAGDGKNIVKNALLYLKKKTTWVPAENSTLFKGVYYDSEKLGSYITKAINKNKQKGIIKIQLRPLDFDEGYIMRQIDKHSKSKRIRMPKIISDKAWNEEDGFGYIIFEDLSHLPDVWRKSPTLKKDRKLHAVFLNEFINKFIPIEPWFQRPEKKLKEIAKKQFFHFSKIARHSNHKHIEWNEIEKMQKAYFEILDRKKLSKLHFTHGHLSGKDIKYDKNKDQFILMANLYWSYRQVYQEISFPVWVDIMHIRDSDYSLDKALKRIESWNSFWQNNIYDHNPIDTEYYWINLLERSMLTTMLDIGSSEWPKQEKAEMQALLNTWKDLFYWIFENKL